MASLYDYIRSSQQKPKTTSKPVSKPSTPKVSSSSSFVSTTPVKKSAYQLQLEKIARTEAHKTRSVQESFDIHTEKIKGQSSGNTDNYFVNNKTGESSKRASDVTSVNLEQYLQERGLKTLTPSQTKPKKLIAERNASKTREAFLRNSAEIKAQGGKVPELDLRNSEQVSKYNEISNIITQSKPDTSESAFQEVTSKVSSFLSLDNPITQKPKSKGESQVGITGIEDTSVIAQGFTPENTNGVLHKDPIQTNKDEDFTEKSKIGGTAIALGLGALAVAYFLSRRK
jgi:hypothetical protein